MNHRNYANEPTLLARGRSDRKWSVILGCFGALFFLVLVALAGGFFYTANASAQSVVFIRTPRDGEILEAGQPVRVSALARDERKITRIEFWVDNELIDAQESNTRSGINPFPLLTTWYPSEGAHTLIVRAFNRRGDSLQETVYVGATALVDRDADGVADAADACADQPGALAADGCPDRDFDGIADATDSCPDEAGLPASGCPAPSAEDRDGDGVLDTADLCPDVVGSPLADGCPDADADGVGDPSDSCPAEAGAGDDGCPASEESDPEADAGAPPLPFDGEEPPDPADDEEAASGGSEPLPELEIFVPLEVEASVLYIREPYERVWCYVQLGNEEPRRYDFSAEGGQYWNIAEEFGGENSARLLQNQSEPLAVSLNCLGANGDEEPQEIEPLSAVHPPDEWDGRGLQMRPEGENMIQVIYHICTPSCAESAFQIPQLAPITTGPIGNGPYLLRWRWGGNESEIGGFMLRRMTGSGSEDNIWVSDPSARSLNLADYMPACGETVEFYAAVFRDTETGRLYSPPSNTVSWAAAPCSYTANVTFTALDVHNPPADEQGLHRPGPIYGEFWVSNGTEIERIEFSACSCYFGPGMTFWGTCDGLELQTGQYSIQRDIFAWIEREQASCLGNGCASNDYFAPFNTVLNIPLEDGDDLTVGSRIMDCDARNADDVLYEEQESVTINIDELDFLTQALSRTINGTHLNLNYFIRMGR